MHVQSFKRQIKERIILMDGAMGTYFSRLHPENGEAESANTTHPEWVTEIHERYIDAGARLIRTNTFAVNHMLFTKEEMEKNLVAAVRNANAAVAKSKVNGLQKEDTVWIAGSVGPIRCRDDREEEEVADEYRFICETLFSQGIRIFCLETFSDTKMVTRIVRQLHEIAGDEEIFVLAQFSVNRMGYTRYGYSMQRIVDETEKEMFLDGIGFNCGIGPTHMNKLIGQITFSGEQIFSVLPNAGYEHMLRGRQFQMDNPVYFASVMEPILAKGANLVGGCCGTTPEYIRELAKILEKQPVPAKKTIADLTDKSAQEGSANPLTEKMNRGERVYVVEIDSPFNANADRFLESAYRLKENDVDLVTISDSPMARSRAEAFEMGIYISNQTGIRVMPHVCCRDRNLIALRSSILGGYINGIRDMLIITGDPVGRDDRNLVSGVFDMNSVKLMDYVKNMNREILKSDPICYGGALNYAGVNVDAIAGRMMKKMEAGCSYFLTQPVYSDEDIARVRELREKTGARIILGIMPLVSYKNAMYMKNELPGINVPDEIVNRYHPDMTRKEAEETAGQICVEIGEKAMDFADGFYLMTPFNRVSLVNGIINRLRELEDTAPKTLERD